MNKPRLIQQAARDDCTIKDKARRRSLGQVVSKMFGWPAEVFDSLGGGKLVYTTDPETGKQVFKAEFAAQAKATLKRTNMSPLQVARYPDALLVNKAKDAGWILTGGFI